MVTQPKSHFERNWLIVFLVLYALIMLPLPWYYSEAYIPSFWGVPLFVFGWLAHGVVVLILTAVYARQCLKRPEYQDFELGHEDHRSEGPHHER
ncbi:hypothetical protein AB8Q18_07360 [Neisseriaceae bacterium CLB008]|nr:hypothetical protein [Neisseriaceae bacterium]